MGFVCVCVTFKENCLVLGYIKGRRTGQGCGAASQLCLFSRAWCGREEPCRAWMGDPSHLKCPRLQNLGKFSAWR